MIERDFRDMDDKKQFIKHVARSTLPITRFDKKNSYDCKSLFYLNLKADTYCSPPRFYSIKKFRKVSGGNNLWLILEMMICILRKR